MNTRLDQYKQKMTTIILNDIYLQGSQDHIKKVKDHSAITFTKHAETIKKIMELEQVPSAMEVIAHLEVFCECQLKDQHLMKMAFDLR